MSNKGIPELKEILEVVMKMHDDLTALNHRVDTRFDEFDKRFDEIGERLDKLEAEVKNLRKAHEILTENISEALSRIDLLEKRVKKLENLEDRVSQLEKSKDKT